MWRLERALEKVALKLRLKRRVEFDRVEFDQQRGEQGRAGWARRHAGRQQRALLVCVGTAGAQLSWRGGVCVSCASSALSLSGPPSA